MTVYCSTAFGCPEELYLFFTMTLMLIAFYKFQALFGVKCTYCLRFISGKVLQAGENNHFHPTCARCTKCGEPFGDGEEMFLQVIDRVILFLIILKISNNNYSYITPLGDRCFTSCKINAQAPNSSSKLLLLERVSNPIPVDQIRMDRPKNDKNWLMASDKSAKQVLGF